jgi:outer membrane protein TolC
VKPGTRLDLKSDEANMKSAMASAKVEEESLKPSLNLYGSYSMNQIESTNQQAIANSFDPKGRSGWVGVRLSMPINFGLTSDIKEGAIKSASAAKLNYKQKSLNEQNDWWNLVQNMANYKANLGLAISIEKAQRVKLENERALLRQGRTTTYQILLFEQDYSNSELTTIQMAYKFLEAIAEEKLYHNEYN